MISVSTLVSQAKNLAKGGAVLLRPGPGWRRSLPGFPFRILGVPLRLLGGDVGGQPRAALGVAVLVVFRVALVTDRGR